MTTSKRHSSLPSDERILEYVQAARKVLNDELPAGHKLWKSWAYDLADNVLALARQRGALVEQLEALDRERGIEESNAQRWMTEAEDLKEQIETLEELLRVSVGFWIATPQEFIDAQHRVPDRDKVEQIAAIVSTPAKEQR